MGLFNNNVTKTATVIFLLAPALIACKKEDDQITQGESESTTFNKTIEIDTTFSQFPHGTNFKHDKLIIAGQSHKNNESNAFLVVVDHRGEILINQVFQEAKTFTGPDFLMDGGYICRDLTGPNIYLIDSHGNITSSFDVFNILRSPLELEINVFPIYFVNELGQIVLHGFARDSLDMPHSYIAKINTSADILDFAIYDLVIQDVGQLPNNEMVMFSLDLTDLSNAELHFVDENLEITTSVSVSNLESYHAGITSSPNLNEFYFDRHKFDNKGTLLFTNDPGMEQDVDELSMTNDGGLLAGGYWWAPESERLFFLEKLSSSNGDSQWKIKLSEGPPFEVLGAYELSYGAVIGVSYKLRDFENTDVTVFKVNSQGEI